MQTYLGMVVQESVDFCCGLYRCEMVQALLIPGSALACHNHQGYDPIVSVQFRDS
jgi:hypothetical protein